MPLRLTKPGVGRNETIALNVAGRRIDASVSSPRASVARFAARAPPEPPDVAKIKAALLIHHGGLDKKLSEGYPAQEAELKKNKIVYEGHIYPNSVHGFFNDATPERYNKAAADQAWNRTIEWFNQYVRTATS